MAKNKVEGGISAKRVREFQRAREVLLKHWPRLKRRKGVHGVEVGLRERNHEFVDEVVLKVIVDEKIKDDQLPASRRIGPEIDGVPVDIVAQGRYKPSPSPRVPVYDTVQGGIAIRPGSKPAKFGTLGIALFFRDGSGTRKDCFLTNAHVALGKFAKPNDLPPDQPILQSSQSTSDTRTIGTVLKAKTILNSLVDCALIDPSPDVPFQPGIRGIAVSQFKIGRLVDADVNNRVRVAKVGAATGPREGIVASITRTFNAPGTPERPGTTFFLQIAVRPVDGGQPFSAAGDSGAVVLRDNEIVGLLHGLTDDGIAIACHFFDVQSQLKLKLDV
jgi:hypothetical protein